MLGKQNLRLLAVSLLIIFFLSLLTLYHIITTTSLPSLVISKPSFVKEDGHYDFEDKLAPDPNSYDKNEQNPAPNTISDQVPVRYGSGIISPSQSQVSNLQGSDNFDKTETEIKARIEQVDKVCRKYHLGRYKHSNNSNDLGLKEPPTPLWSYYFWNKERHLAYCPVYKAGSTSWLVNMMILAGYSEQDLKNSPKQLSILAREVYGDKEPGDEVCPE